MRDRFRRLGLALPLVVACSSPTADARSAPSVDETWYAITFHGKKVGYIRSREGRAELEGREAVHVERWSVITVRRREQMIRMEHELDAWFTPKGGPLRYTIVRKEGGEMRRGEGRVEGGRFVVEQTVGGRVQTRSFELKAGDRLASSLEWLHLRTPRPGQAITGRALDETEGDLQSFTLVIGDEPTGPRDELLPVQETLGGVKSQLLVRRSGGLVRSELVGAGIVMERTSRDAATRLDEAVDIFSAALFPVKVDLPSRDRLQAVTTVFSTEREVAPTIRAYDRQTVKALDRGRVEVRVEAPPTPRTGPPLPVPSPEQGRFLSATDYEDLADPRLVQTARREIGDADDAWTAARRLNRFVHRHLENKTLAHAFASATEALVEKAGDCTEHAVLFSALAKIVGIPTKLVTGLVYVGGSQPAFGYHEWVEVWLGGAWHPMDPTFGQDVADPTHIKFSEGLSDPEGLRDAGLAAAALIGDVHVEISSFVTDDGETRRP